MTREQYPALAAWRRGQILRPMVPARSCVWTETLVELADKLAPGISVEVECQDCDGRGYVDRVFDLDGQRALKFDAMEHARDHLETQQHGGRAAWGDGADDAWIKRRWCACYDDPAPVLGRRTYTLADLIRAHVDRKPWAAEELAVLAELLMAQGGRWGLWLAHWMAPARPRRRRRPRRWSGRPPVRRSKRVQRPRHPARKELEGELALVAQWAQAERRRARERRWASLDTTEIFDDTASAMARMRGRIGESLAPVMQDLARRLGDIIDPTQAAAQSMAAFGIDLPDYQRRWMATGDRVTIAEARRWRSRYGGVMVTQPEPLMFLDDLVGPQPARLRGRQGYAILDDAAYQAPPSPPAPEPSRSRQGPPIGDRLARRLRRGRPR